MATGQTIITIGAVILFGIIAVNVQQIYVQAVMSRVEYQSTSSALSIGSNLAEEIQSYAFDYNELDNTYGGLNNLNDPLARLEIRSQIDELFYVTIELSNEKELVHNIYGRTATIRVHNSSDLELKSEYVTAVIPMQ